MKVVKRFIFGVTIPDDATFLFYDPREDSLVYEVPLHDEKAPRKKSASDHKEVIEDVIHHLNAITGSKYTSKSDATVKLIRARLNEGRTLEDFKEVINRKSAQWLDDPKWSQFLRPQTLFGNKFDGYLSIRTGEEKADDVFGELDQILKGANAK